MVARATIDDHRRGQREWMAITRSMCAAADKDKEPSTPANLRIDDRVARRLDEEREQRPVGGANARRECVENYRRGIDSDWLTPHPTAPGHAVATARHEQPDGRRGEEASAYDIEQ